jgi:O-antigen ligase
MFKRIKNINLKRIIEYSFYLFAFFFPLQTKLIIKSGDSNYNEIALFANYLLLAIIFLLFLIYKIKNKKEEGVSTGLDKHWIILAAIEFFIFLSIFVSISTDLSIFRYILFLLSIAMMFMMLNFKFDFKKIILFFLAGLLLQAILGIGQVFTQKTFSCKYLGIACHDVTESGTSVIETINERFLRAYGATDHPNIFGALMFFAVFLSIMIIVKNNYHGTRRLLAYLSLFVFFIALWVSFSRSALLATGISLLFLLVAFYLESKKLFMKYLPIFILLILLSGVLTILFKPIMIVRMETNSRLEKISINERQEQIATASTIIKKYPWLGVGLGAYHDKLLVLDSNLASYEAQPVHNTFILIWAEIGLWGLMFFIYLLFYLLKRNIKKLYYFPLFIGLLIFMLFDHWLWSLPWSYLFLFFILALTFYLKQDNSFENWK